MTGRPSLRDRAQALLEATSRARTRAQQLVESSAALQGQATQLALQGRRLRDGNARALSGRLGAALREALAEQHERLRADVDNDVLQYLCAARQDLLEIQQAQPSDALTAALDNVTAGIDALRRLVEREAGVDADLVLRAEAYIRGTLRPTDG